VNVAVEAANTFQDAAGPYARSENATAASATAHNASVARAPAILRRVIHPAVLDDHRARCAS
jgi:hypothetical protein